jgi:hypothetical protein
LATLTNRPLPIEEMRPPEPPGPLSWIRQNLFYNWYNSLLTVLALGLISDTSALPAGLVRGELKPVLNHLMLTWWASIPVRTMAVG